MRIIVVSGTLPLHGKKEGDAAFAPSYASVSASILHGIGVDKELEMVFVGTPYVNGLPEYEKAPSSLFTFTYVQTEKRPYDLVFSRHISRACHHSLGKSALFPSDLDQPYKEYSEFNRSFASAIGKVYKENDRIVIMGKHLLLLPEMLRKMIPSAYIIILFLSPFPTYEVFSCIPYSKEVVRSMLCSNRIEFQAEEYTNNFVRTCFSLINAQHNDISQKNITDEIDNEDDIKTEKPIADKKGMIEQLLEMQSNGAPIASSCSFFCNNDPLFSDTLETENRIVSDTSVCPEEYLQDTVLMLKQQKKETRNRKYIVYVEQLQCLVCTTPPCAPKDFLHGVQQTERYKQALDEIEKKEKGRKVVLIIESTRKTSCTTSFIQTALWYLKKYSSAPVDFVRCVVYGESSAEPNLLLAGVSEILSATFPGRMHTVMFPSTYVYAALLARADVCLVGEKCDAFSLVLNEYLILNPKGKVVTHFSSGISIPGIYYSPSCIYVMAESLKNSLESTDSSSDISDKKCPRIHDISAWIKDICKVPTFSMSGVVCKALDASGIEEMKKSYALAKQRIFLLDYDGTLAEIVANPRDAKPTEEILALLSDLAADTRNRVVIVTGRGKEEAEEWFSTIPGLVIYAEHGAYKKESGEWAQVSCDLSWMSEAQKIVERYVVYTPKSHMEIKNTCIVFHCGENGRWCANALQEMLHDRARIVTGKGIVEIRPLMVDKGQCAEKEYKQKSFCLCAGDDLTDEDMFMMVKKETESYCICVGERKTCAPHRLDSPSSMRRLLRMLAEL